MMLPPANVRPHLSPGFGVLLISRLLVGEKSEACVILDFVLARLFCHYLVKLTVSFAGSLGWEDGMQEYHQGWEIEIHLARLAVEHRRIRR